MEYTKSVKTACHSEGALRLFCHSERSEESRIAQCKLRDRRMSLRVNSAKNLTTTEPRDPSLPLRVTNEGSPRITVLGIGNLLLKDEGVGVHLVQKLAGIVDNAKVNIIDAGTSPDFLSLIDRNIDKLIVVDAVKADNKPGTIYRFSPDNLDLDSTSPVSLHEIGVLDSLKIMALFDRLPESTVIIGIEPKTIDFGLELSPEVEEKVPEIINLVLKEIEETTAMEVRNDNL